MTRLAERLKAEIEASGPIPVSEFMMRCLLDPRDGYYTNRDPFGAAGDFITAPEISQMFGELLGAWVVTIAGEIETDTIRLVELGPGRGTLMSDMLRTIARLDPRPDRWRVSLIEASPKLREIQRQTLSAFATPMDWHESLADLPAGPAVFVGNEIFDALPVRQFVLVKEGWRERLVGIDENRRLTFVAGAGGLAPALLPPEAGRAAKGAIFEYAPVREALMADIAARIEADGGAGLFFDYGHLQSSVGDTLQAVRRHAFEDVFLAPGEADLTSHVDFSALAEVARRMGLAPRLAEQGDFLLSLGLVERAGRLGAASSQQERELIAASVERLAGPAQMGSLFKVLGVARDGSELPGFSRSAAGALTWRPR